jgi:hypothetical protein
VRHRIIGIIASATLAFGQGNSPRNCRPAGDGCNTVCDGPGMAQTVTTGYCGPWSDHTTYPVIVAPGVDVQYEMGPSGTRINDKMMDARGFNSIYHENFEYHAKDKRLVVRSSEVKIDKFNPTNLPLAQIKSAAQDEPKPTACGIQASTATAEYYTSCVDFDKLRELTGMPASGKYTQVFVDPRNQSAVAVRVTAKRGEETLSYLAEPYTQPSGRRVAAVVFADMDWETVGVQVLVEEK